MPYKDTDKQKAYLKEHYVDNKKLYSERSMANKRIRRAYARKVLIRYKLKFGCAECGYKEHHAALHFHHLRDKKYNIAMLLGDGTKFSRVKNEVRKCIILCANCHSIHHHNERSESNL